jgi:periplasmic protein CpxP/Spy
MKKLLLIVLIAIGISGFAQKANGSEREQYSPEQKATIMSKKMRNSLDLTEQQTNEVKALLLSKIEKNSSLREKIKAKRASGEKFSKDERFAMQNARLDEKATTIAEFKKILSPEQFAKFEVLKEKRMEKMIERKMAKKEKRVEKKSKLK